MQLGLRLLMALLPAVMAILAFIVMRFYPITEKVFAEMVEDLHERREAERAAGAGGAATA